VLSNTALSVMGGMERDSCNEEEEDEEEELEVVVAVSK
jgi:hypothetical protein